MEKRTILHIINRIGIGGAEILLLNITRTFDEYNHVVVATEKIVQQLNFPSYVKIIELKSSGLKDIFKAIQRVKKIIKDVNPLVVHSHLYYSSLVAKLACNKNIPLVISLHNEMSKDLYFNKWYSFYNLFLDRITFKEKHFIIGVSKLVIEDFNKYIHTKANKYVLYNFVENHYFDFFKANYSRDNRPFRLIAVGNIRKQKNYELLIETFKKYKISNIEIDVFGEGDLKEYYKKETEIYNLPINFKGKGIDLFNILHQYDGFIMPSSFEGFGISVAEAMAVGLPLLLSDLPIFREVTNNNALFFSPSDPKQLLNTLEKFKTLNEQSIIETTTLNKQIAKNKYSSWIFKKDLMSIYNNLS